MPGVTAASSAAAELGISLTQRGIARSVTFLTPRALGGARCDRWLTSALASDTVVLYMASQEFPALAQALLDRGKDPLTPLAWVESASLGARLSVTRLGDCILNPPARSAGPVTVVMGAVVSGAEVADAAAALPPCAGPRPRLRGEA